MPQLSIAVHGGAGALTDTAAAGAKAGCARAAAAGYRVLQRGGSALDAVEAAVRVLEDDERFNAGRGCVLTRDGTVEMDALVMEGAGMRAGAVAGTDAVANPVSLARAVMDRSPHVLICGAIPTRAFAERVGSPTLPPGATVLITDRRRRQLEDLLAERAREEREAMGRASNSTYALGALVPPAPLAPLPASAAVEASASPEPCDGKHDTVGAVAVDSTGTVAAATSTGGLCGKWSGRIGDSPLIGAGAYAENSCGACSTTGTGEFIMRTLLAREACSQYEAMCAREKPSPAGAVNSHAGLATRAAHAAIEKMGRLKDPYGAGLIFVSPSGDVGIAHSSPRMSFAFAHGMSEAASFRLVSGCEQQALQSARVAEPGSPQTKAATRTPRVVGEPEAPEAVEEKMVGEGDAA